MRKFAAVIFACLAFSFMLAGCTMLDMGILTLSGKKDEGSPESVLQPVSFNVNIPGSGADDEGYGKIKDPDGNGQAPSDTIPADVIVLSGNSYVSAKPVPEYFFDESKFSYHRLGEHEQKVYTEIYDILLNRDGERVLSSLDVDEIDKCFNCVMTDNPDFYYTDGYRMTKTTVDDKLKSISFDPRYTMTASEILSMEDKIDDYVKLFIESMPDFNDEYSKAKYIFDYLVDHTEYETTAENSQNICSVFANGKSVCQGYSMAAKYLCDEAGVLCTVVYGEASGQDHAWNMMRLDGTYCHVDVTWGDTSFKNSMQNTNEAMTDYVFFGANDAIISTSHRMDHIVQLPACTSLSSYYFVKEGRYFTKPDAGMLDDLFDKAYESEDRLLTIRCADGSVYDEFNEYLFDKGNIFEFIRGAANARYVRNREELTITFVL